FIDPVGEGSLMQCDLTVSHPIEVQGSYESQEKVFRSTESRVDRLGEVRGRPVPEAIDVERGRVVLHVGAGPDSFPEISDRRQQELLESQSVRAWNESGRVVALRGESDPLSVGDGVVDGADDRI